MSEEVLVRCCAPTLAGLKTGNMFIGEFSSREERIEELRQLNARLKEKGIRVIPLKCDGNKTLIYLYRPNKLKKDFQDDAAMQLLKELGYCEKDPTACVTRVAKKIRQTKSFPHEIGLFLGYPPDDVDGFIKNKACNYKCVGCWKVYGDKDRAEKLFCSYKKCVKIYTEQWAKGRSVERLTVRS